ncbi:HD domain-containing protein [Corallococcus exiguus]|uniref:HD-CE domain-containing protein n=1 Tax=Corallococcus exiguus TaxID=83462 RepID=A0A7X4Y9Z3_9BACT|nr:ATP-binding protein [Corallococcus exiguus]NBC40864.1 hypothetical protein [Corallococcus exiguus]TNV64494.1 hypothetical protein FH620_12260 [Corallococcus exiguus]
MIDFENALREWSNRDPQYEVLWAQWTYDKRLVSRALQAVGVLFPHYSLHDESHSNTILRQLARVLGPSRIARLSPTDIWLLLEAAYHHDIGMVVPDARKRAWWSNQPFKIHLLQLAESHDPDLRRAARTLSTRTFESLGDEWPFEVQRALLLAMADYARKQHPAMAEEIVETPARISLDSPRILIPRRLFQLLALICRHHGSSFEKTLELPGRESGYGTDEAHPRFVGCMLRLGDLLDLDDGRFCPTLIGTMGRLPPSSRAHERKHASIRHLLVSPKIIEVEAVCERKDVAAYEETERWLSWLRDELKNQAARWAEIAPTEDFGTLPSVGRITAKIEGHITIGEGRLPRFEVERDSIIKLVQGANIYERPTSFIRELLQNAVDATLLRCWNDHHSEILEWEKDLKNQDKALDNLRGILKNYPIQVKVTNPKKRSTISAPKGRDDYRFKVVIEDKGWGISRQDIHYLQQIGGSSKNQRKQFRRIDMPEWMQPSGVFGIGLQSVFLFAQRVVITTRPDDSPEILRITLRKGYRGSVGQILVEELDQPQARLEIGTTIVCEINMPSVPKAMKHPFDSPEIQAAFSDFDPVKDSTLLYKFALAKDEVRKFANESLCQLSLNGITLTSTPSLTGTTPQEQSSIEDSRYFDKKTNIEIIFANPNRGIFVSLFYRGAPLAREFQSISDILSFDVDLHFGGADKFLGLSRDNVRPDKKAWLNRRINKALLNVFPRYYENLRAQAEKNDSVNADELGAASLFAEVNGKHFKPHLISHQEWQSLDWIDGISLGDLVKFDIIELRETGDYSSKHRLEMSHDENISTCKITTSPTVSDWLWQLLSLKHQPTLIAAHANHAAHYRFHRVSGQLLAPLPDDAALRSALQLIVHPDRGMGSRNTLPCPRGFELLRIERSPPYVNQILFRLPLRIVCPFTIKPSGEISVPNIVDAVRWTARNAADESIQYTAKPPSKSTLALISSKMLELIEHINRLMDNAWSSRRAYDLEQIRRELGNAFGPEAIKPSIPQHP